MSEKEREPVISRYTKPSMQVYEVTIRGFILADVDLPHPEAWGWDDLTKRVKMDFVTFPDIDIDQSGVDVYESSHPGGSGTLEIIDGKSETIYAFKGWDKKGNVVRAASYEELKPSYDKILSQQIWHIPTIPNEV
tara:strand:- start:261 stop:665 length:405 start_codon:yes stop_codon:yes gene_type:complete